jgi:hypothetical protein
LPGTFPFFPKKQIGLNMVMTIGKDIGRNFYLFPLNSLYDELAIINFWLYIFNDNPFFSINII